MADDTGQSEQGETESIVEAAIDANEELGTDFGGDHVSPDSQPEEGGEADASSEESEAEGSSSPDEKQGDTEAEEDDDGDENPETDEEGEVKGETESSEEAEPVSEGEESEEDPDPVPYDRFKEKVDEANKLESEVDQLNEQLETVVDERDQLQQQMQYYTQTQEGQEELKTFLEDQGVIGSGESSGDKGIKEQLEDVKQSLPNQAAEGIEQVLTQIQQQVDQLQEQGQDSQQQFDNQQAVQQRQQELQDRMNSLQEERDEDLVNKVFDPEATKGPYSLAEIVIQENAEKYNDGTGLPDPDKLDELYEETIEAYDLQPNGTQPDSSSGVDSGNNAVNPNANGDVSFEDLPEEQQQKVRQQVIEDMQENAEDEPLEPSGGNNSPTEVSEADDLQSAIESAKQETGVSLG